MLIPYLSTVMRRALQPTARITDAAQVLAASALPGISKFFGIKLPDTVTSDALAYIGAAALSYVAIRFLWAPYAIWKDDQSRIAELKSELSKPERMELAHIAKRRAKARMQLAAALRTAHLQIFFAEKDQARFVKNQKNIARLAALVALSENALEVLIHIQSAIGVAHSQDPPAEVDKHRLGSNIANMLSYLHGHLKEEDLVLCAVPDDQQQKAI